jgi:hypothetical protein
LKLDLADTENEMKMILERWYVMSARSGEGGDISGWSLDAFRLTGGMLAVPNFGVERDPGFGNGTPSARAVCHDCRKSCSSDLLSWKYTQREGVTGRIVSSSVLERTFRNDLRIPCAVPFILKLLRRTPGGTIKTIVGLLFHAPSVDGGAFLTRE